MVAIKRDCKHFEGYRPCVYHKKDGSMCSDCRHYQKHGKKILIINYQGIGDVLRATALVPALKEKYPECRISFLTEKQGFEIIKRVPEIDVPLLLNFDSVLRLQIEMFDILINYEKEDSALALANLVKADKKFGIYMDETGHMAAFNKDAEILIDLGISDEIKGKKNKKVMQQIMFEIAGLTYIPDKHKPLYNIPDDARRFAKQFFEAEGVNEKDLVVGLNTGVGSRIFPNRKWPETYFAELADMLTGTGIKVVLLGGPEERETNRKIKSKATQIIDAGTDNSLDRFSALIERCNLIVTVDTLALHIAAALEVPVVALFGPTNKHELEIYGKGEKLSADMECIACYKHKCPYYDDPECMKKLTPEIVFSSIKKTLGIHENERKQN